MNQHEFNQQLCSFLTAATTPFHAVAEMSHLLEAAGFTRLAEAAAWDVQAGGRHFVIRNDSSIVAFVVGQESAPIKGMRMVGAHTDSPCLMVKPSPEIERNGYFQLGVQVYGGALLNPWFDRDLSLAGRVSFQCEDGQLHTALIDYRDAIATIPSLAIHLDKEANKNRSVNPQTDIVPVICQLGTDEKADFRALLRSRLLAEHPNCQVQQVLDYELSFYDTQAPAVMGLKGEFIASARLDNLLSCFTGLQSLLQCDGGASALLVCNDHEEVGSLSAAGAQGPLLSSVLKRLVRDEQAYAALTDRSMMISADNAHGIHPNYADRHDENHGPLLNRGPVIKINANQRYASTSETSGFFRILSSLEEVAVQSFVVRTDMGCGSTIGPITAGGTGIRTLDIGVPTFAMHSIRELAGNSDAWDLCRVLRRFYNYPELFRQPEGSMKVLLLSAYAAQSHVYWQRCLQAMFEQWQWRILSLPPRHFSWRVRGNALYWAVAEREILERDYDLLVATSMVDLATLRGLVPALADVPAVVYFHENQFDYPQHRQQHGLLEAQMVSIYSALAADRVLFNSAYNLETFMAGCKALLAKLPDRVPPGILPALLNKSGVLPVPLDRTDLLAVEPYWPGTPGDIRVRPLRLVWVGRFEHDKGGGRLLQILLQLERTGQQYELAVVGQQFRSSPEVFQQIEDTFSHRLVQFGYVESAETYRALLQGADIVLSTALHEFQGLAVLEAVASHCLPAVPNRLVYPHIYPAQFCYESDLDDPEIEAVSAVRLIQRLAAQLQEGVALAPDVASFSRGYLAHRYADEFLGLAGRQDSH